MKKSVRNILLATISLTFLITILSAVFATASMINNFDHAIGHFDADSVVAKLAMYLPLAAPVVAAVCGILIRKEFSLRTPYTSDAISIFVHFLLGLLMISAGVLALMDLIPQMTDPYIITTVSKTAVGAAITAVISGICFIVTPILKDRPWVPLLSIVPAIWAALSLIEEYFREGGPINSPIRTINLAMFAFLLLFFTEEIRFAINRQLTGAYYFCLLSAIAFTGAATFPKLIIIITGNNSVFEFDLITWCVGAAAFIFLLAKLAALPAAYKPFEPIIKPTKAAAPKTAAYIPDPEEVSDAEAEEVSVAETEKDSDAE